MGIKTTIKHSIQEVVSLDIEENWVAHYTSLDAFQNMINHDDQGGYVTFWATRYGYFEDANEYKWGLKYIIPKIIELAKKDEIDIESNSRFHPYVLSFCKNINDIRMWDNYGRNGKGIMLIFDKNKIQKEIFESISETQRNRLAKDIIYARKDNIDILIQDALIELEYDVDEDLLYLLPAFIKNEDTYYWENEFRVAHFEGDGFRMSKERNEIKSHEIKEFAPENMKLRKRGDSLIPYIEIILTRDCFVGFCLGEKVDTPENRRAVELFLEANSFISFKTFLPY